MDINKIETTLREESGIGVCPICGVPFKPYHSRQKTCGNSECKRIYHIESVKARTEKLRSESPDEYNRYRRECSRRARAKKKSLRIRESQLKDMAERWGKQSEFDNKISEYGLEYGKRSAEKVLSTVPKIDVTAFMKEINNGKELCNKD